MASNSTLLIIGGGLAGAKAAEGARESGYDGRIVLVCEEARNPYERPPLSKDILRGEKEPDSSQVHESGYYAEHSIELLTGDAITSLDVGAKRAQLRAASRWRSTRRYWRWELRRVRSRCPGADLSGVHYLRTVEDSVALHEPSRTRRGWRSSVPAGSARRSPRRPGRWVLTSC